MRRFKALICLVLAMCSVLCSCDMLVPVMTNHGTDMSYPGLDPSRTNEPALSDQVFRASTNDYTDTGIGFITRKDEAGILRADPVFPTAEATSAWNKLIAPGVAALTSSDKAKKLDFELTKPAQGYVRLNAVFQLAGADGWEVVDNAFCYWNGSAVVGFKDLFKFDDYRTYLSDFFKEQTDESFDKDKVEKFVRGEMSFDKFEISDEGVTVFVSGADLLKDGAEGELLIPADYFTGYIVERYARRWAEYKPVTDPTEKVIAITFDDGPTSKFTPMVLDVLEKYQVKATFFMVGHRLKSIEANKRAEILTRLLNDGSQLANHSYNHPNFNLMDFDAIKKELDDTNQLIFEATGYTPICMRPPYGNLNKVHLGKIGMFCILWSVDTLDWSDRDSEILKTKVLTNPGVRSGDIVLMHEIHESTVNALDDLVKGLLDQGYRFVTVEELYDMRGKEVDQRKYFSLKTITSPLEL